MAGPCDGLVVLDFSWGMAGGLATAVLADFGADVIKIEPPAGDPFRSHPAWLAWNRGKKSAVLDLKTAQGRTQAQRLAEQADVVLESFRPGVAHRLGIDYATLSAINPRLVYASISGWGQQGPLSQVAGYEGVIAAKSGRMTDFAGPDESRGTHLHRRAGRVRGRQARQPSAVSSQRCSRAIRAAAVNGSRPAFFRT